MPVSGPKKASKIDELPYEKALERLEAIVARIESGEAGLEESIALYEEGVALGTRCRKILSQAEQRVEFLTKETSGGKDAARDDSAQEG